MLRGLLQARGTSCRSSCRSRRSSSISSLNPNILLHPGLLRHPPPVCDSSLQRRPFSGPSTAIQKMASNGGQKAILNASPSATLVDASLAPLVRHEHAFCGDSEGWGPISSLRFDLTPCFLDIWVSVVAAWGLFLGAGALYMLLKNRTPQPVQKNWHFYTKLVWALENPKGAICVVSCWDVLMHL